MFSYYVQYLADMHVRIGNWVEVRLLTGLSYSYLTVRQTNKIFFPGWLRSAAPGQHTWVEQWPHWSKCMTVLAWQSLRLICRILFDHVSTCVRGYHRRWLCFLIMLCWPCLLFHYPDKVIPCIITLLHLRRPCHRFPLSWSDREENACTRLGLELIWAIRVIFC